MLPFYLIDFTDLKEKSSFLQPVMSRFHKFHQS